MPVPLEKSESMATRRCVSRSIYLRISSYSINSSSTRSDCSTLSSNGLRIARSSQLVTLDNMTYMFWQRRQPDGGFFRSKIPLLSPFPWTRKSDMENLGKDLGKGYP